MFTCPPLPADFSAYAMRVLRGGGTVVFSGRSQEAFARTLGRLGIDVAGLAQDPSEADASTMVRELAGGRVVVWEEFIDFPRDCLLNYEVRFQYSQVRGWNAAVLRTDGQRRYFTKPA
jgi:hypothetical protein